MNIEISLDTIIEDLVEAEPESVTFLMEKGIRCLRCGEPIWGTLGEAMDEKEFSGEKQARLVEELKTALTAQQ